MNAGLSLSNEIDMCSFLYEPLGTIVFHANFFRHCPAGETVRRSQGAWRRGAAGKRPRDASARGDRLSKTSHCPALRSRFTPARYLPVRHGLAYILHLRPPPTIAVGARPPPPRPPSPPRRWLARAHHVHRRVPPGEARQRHRRRRGRRRDGARPHGLQAGAKVRPFRPSRATMVD